MNRMNLNILLGAALVFIAFQTSAQTESNEIAKTHNHEHHRNEIGIENSPVYFINEKVLAYGLHIHFVRNIPKTRLGIGLGYERIFDDHRHNTFGLVGIIRPAENISFSVIPGLTFEDKEKSARFSIHLEAAYEWEIKDFHIGPVIKFAYDQEDYHTGIGLHIGYGF